MISHHSDLRRSVHGRRVAARHHTRRGAVLVLVTLSLVALGLFVGLVVDVGMVYQERRRQQAAADAAAYAGAAELFRGRPVADALARARATATGHGYTQGGSVSVAVSTPPASGYASGVNGHVRVTVSRALSNGFARLAGFSTFSASARAVAGTAAGRTCVSILDPTTERALAVSSGSTLTLMNCAMMVNSAHIAALHVSSGSTVSSTGSRIGVTGGAIISGSTVTPTAATSAPPEPDPIGYAAPTIPTGCLRGSSGSTSPYKPRSAEALLPGVYCGGLEIDQNVTFNPGLYVLRGGGLKIASSAVVTGSGVTIINTTTNYPNQGGSFTKIEIVGDGNVTLSAMTSGPTAGVLFFQLGLPNDADGQNSTENLIYSQKGCIALTGSVYIPQQKLKMANSQVCPTRITGGIVARELVIESNHRVIITQMSAAASPFRRVALVD